MGGVEICENRNECNLYIKYMLQPKREEPFTANFEGYHCLIIPAGQTCEFLIKKNEEFKETKGAFELVEERK